MTNEQIAQISREIERQLFRYPLSDEDRSDLLQSTLIQVIRKMDTFRGESQFSTWLFKVTSNEALMHLRREKKMRARTVHGLEQEVLEKLPAVTRDARDHDLKIENKARDEEIRVAISALPEAYRNVVVAHYHLDLDLHEIAERMEITESSVRSRLHRARTSLKEVLKHFGDEENRGEWNPSDSLLAS